MAGSDGQALNVDYIVPPGQLEPFPENPQDPLDPGLLANIDHIVVLMMENRSFDHMLGYLSKEGGRSDINGLRGGEKDRYKGTDYPSFPLPDTRFDESPGHGPSEVENEVDGGKMDGFVTVWRRNSRMCRSPAALWAITPRPMCRHTMRSPVSSSSASAGSPHIRGRPSATGFTP